MHSSSRNELTSEKVIWSIKNFIRIPPRVGFPFKSSVIHKRHARKTWRFFLHPSGNSDPNCMSAYLKKAFFMFDPTIYNCSLSIGSSDGNPVKSFEFKSMDLQLCNIGRSKCIRKESIEKLLKGSVTVKCEITEVNHKSYLPSLMANFEKLSSDLTALYDCPMFYDMTIFIQQSEFHLHSCVLYARCRHFCQLFGYQSFNEMPKTVFFQLNSISPYIFRQLTYYLYSGKFDDLNLSSELFMLVDQLKLQSLKQLAYEKVQEYRTNTEISIQNLTITWNLEEIRFQEKDSVPFVQMFKTECCTSHLAIRIGIFKRHDGEKFIDISFKVFTDTLYKPVSLLCVLTLFINGKARTYKKDGCNIAENEEWHFPPFVKLSDIPESNEENACSLNVCLTAEITLSDGCPAYNNLHTKTRLFTYSPNIIYPERLGSDMRRLLPTNVQPRFENYDITLKSVDNCFIAAHKAILWARWPVVRDLLKNCNGSESYLSINLRSEEIHKLVDYIYTGSAPSIYHTSADKLQQTNVVTECSSEVVNKCRNFLYGKI